MALDYLREDSEDHTLATGDETQDNESFQTAEVYDECCNAMSKDGVYTLNFATGFGKKVLEHLITHVDGEPGTR